MASNLRGTLERLLEEYSVAEVEKEVKILKKIEKLRAELSMLEGVVV